VVSACRSCTVVVGQRRTLAAQGAGLDEIPVVVMDFDDGDALEASITENVEAFNEDVSRKDRAFAIQRLKDMKGWNNRQVADSLGVHQRVVIDWLEYTRDEWAGTIVDPELDAEEIENEENLEISKKVDDLNPDVVKKVRNIT